MIKYFAHLCLAEIHLYADATHDVKSRGSTEEGKGESYYTKHEMNHFTGKVKECLTTIEWHGKISCARGQLYGLK